jgi:glutamate racemase
MDAHLPIAIFDSGIGGLSVFRALSRLLPQENIIYLADNKRVPYGDLSSETIVRYTSEAVSYLQNRKVKLVVLGCHTASASCLYGNLEPDFQERFSVPVIGVVRGGLLGINQRTDYQRVAVLGTERTIQSGVYDQLIRSQNPNLEVVSIACPLLVPRIESGLSDHPDTESLLRNYLQPILVHPVDAVLLACTHYPLIGGLIQKVLGNNVILLDSSEYTSFEVKEFLTAKNLLNHSHQPNYQFCVTGPAELFVRQVSLLLNNIPFVIEETVGSKKDSASAVCCLSSEVN